MINKDLAQIAYEAYCDQQNWLSYDGKPLVGWTYVREDIKTAWAVSAGAVQKAISNG